MLLNQKKIIIIGGGTAGLTIANKLQDKFNVTVLEQSGNYKLPIINRIPLLIGLLFRKKKKNYIKKKIIKIDNNRKIPLYYPNVLGGSSEINGCVHVFGSKKLWKIFLKKFKINYIDLIYLNKKIFNFNRKKSVKNKINLLEAFNNKLDDIFSKISSDFKLKKITSIYNDNIGFGKIINNSNTYFRSSVLDLVSNKKFNLELNCNVKKIVKKILNNKTFYFIHTNKGIFQTEILILSSGTFSTSKILLKSIKMIPELNKLKNLIGKGIKDHPNLRINVLLNRKFNTLNEISNSLTKKIFLFLKFILKFKNLMNGTGATSAIQINTNYKNTADARINLLQFFETGRHENKNYFNSNPGFSLSITPVSSFSEGFMYLNKNGKSKFKFKYFKEKKDYYIVKKSLNFCIKLLENKNIKNYIKIIDNFRFIKKNPKNYILNNVYSGGHWIGGTSKIINSNFQVKNLKNFYICDASIFDFHVSSNIHSSIILIANLFSDKILKKYK